jgi:hypothetical protein
MAVGLSLGAVVASFASAALGWRFQAALGVVVVEERGGRVVELACFVVGDPGGVTVGRVREDGHTLVLAGGWRARPVSGVGLFLGGQCRAFAFGLVDVDRGRLFCGRARPSGAIAARIFCVSAGGQLELAVRRRSLAGGVFVLALALEGGRGFPVAKRAGGDAEFGGDRLLCHSLAERGYQRHTLKVGLAGKRRPRMPGRPRGSAGCVRHVGCQNSGRRRRKQRFAGGTRFLAPHTWARTGTQHGRAPPIPHFEDARPQGAPTVRSRGPGVPFCS